jgi:predicted 2-oxoglutarate/Fe(II)-dependent dioxygenase YbiX/peroxiredoxin
MIDIGDFGPDLSLRDQHGNPRALYSQEIAGVSNAFFFIEDKTPDGLEKALAAVAAGFSAAMSRPVAVTLLAPEQALAAATAAGTVFPVLSDPDAAMMTAIAGGRPSRSFAATVFDRNGRLLAAGIDDSLENLIGRAAEMCAAEAALYEPGMQTFQAPVLFIPRILEEPECAHLIEFWEAGEKRRNEISSGKAGGNVSGASAEVKRRADVLVPQDDNPANNMIRNRVSRRIVPEMVKAFNFQPKAYDIGRIGCYDAADSGFFRPHRDILSSNQADPRKFALSLNLNDEFTGGALRFPEYGERIYSPPKGGGLVFSCSLLHEALPVESGRRFGLFLFFN